MMTETEKFLEQYKRFESALRDTNTADTVLDYENSLQTDPVNSDTYDKLKTCRIIRNYIQHHPDGAKMFPASSQMTEFIKKTGRADRKQNPESIRHHDKAAGSDSRYDSGTGLAHRRKIKIRVCGIYI